MEIIPETEERIIVREKKRKQAQEQEQDQEPTREVWSEDEEDTHRIQNTALTRPKLEHQVDCILCIYFLENTFRRSTKAQHVK